MSRGKLAPAEVIDKLVSIAPCPIIHSVLELPPDDYAHGRPSRSRYFARRAGRWGREQDFILVNEGNARHWRYVNTLAHELGHALDHHGTHPAQPVQTGARRRRFRDSGDAGHWARPDQAGEEVAERFGEIRQSVFARQRAAPRADCERDGQEPASVGSVRIDAGGYPRPTRVRRDA